MTARSTGSTPPHTRALHQLKEDKGLVPSSGGCLAAFTELDGQVLGTQTGVLQTR